MNYIKKLNLPSIPLRDGVINELTVKKSEFKKKSVALGKNDSYHHPTVITEVNQFLNYELLSALETVGLKPSYFVNFGQLDRLSYTTPIHIDISPAAENKKVAFAVNWELTATQSQWAWWDPADATVIAPSIEDTSVLEKTLLNGLRYVDDQEFKVIESYDLLPHTAYLVRTDLPHNIAYHNPTLERVAISVRFDIATTLSWEDAVKLFDPLIIE